jgi:hypothetical protein
MNIGKLIPVALLLSGATLVMAQNAPATGGGPGAQGGPGGGRPMMDPVARFKELDKNNDGKLSLEEFQAMRMGMGMGMRGGRDGNAPGGPGGQAGAGGQTGPGGQGGNAGGPPPGGMRMDPAVRFKAADKNGDGFLSLEEFTAMMAMRRGGPRGDAAAGAAGNNSAP